MVVGMCSPLLLVFFFSVTAAVNPSAGSKGGGEYWSFEKGSIK